MASKILLLAFFWGLSGFFCGNVVGSDLAFSSPSMYNAVTDPVACELPGFTRSVFARDHALISPESRVFGGMPGWKGADVAFLITPAMGAHFTMYFARMPANASAAPALPGVERFVFVLSGEALVTVATASSQSEASGAPSPQTEHAIKTDGFAYIPPHVAALLASRSGAFLLVMERRYAAPDPGCDAPRPSFLVGTTSQQPLLPAAGEIFKLRKLLPTSPEYDFNIHVMDFEPGEYLNVEELHYNQHGLVLLQGEGIYRLSDKWYPVAAGDVIWMAPFVTQWYGALGKTMSRYILYKDVNRDPLLAG